MEGRGALLHMGAGEWGYSPCPFLPLLIGRHVGSFSKRLVLVLRTESSVEKLISFTVMNVCQRRKMFNRLIEILEVGYKVVMIM